MNRLLAGEVVAIAAQPVEIWELFEDATSLARVLPGCRELQADGPGRFHGLLEARLAFITVRADVRATLADPQPPTAVRLDLEGRPRGLAGGFRASIPIRMAPSGVAAASARSGTAEASGAPPLTTPVHTTVTFDLDLEVSGRLATFGAPLLRSVMRGQVATLVRNVEAEVARRRRAGAGAA